MQFWTHEIEHDTSEARRDDYYCEIPPRQIGTSSGL